MPALQVLSAFNNFHVATLRNWSVSSTDATHIVFRDGIEQLTLLGNFTIGAQGEIGGTVTAVTDTVIGPLHNVDAWKLTVVSFEAGSLAKLIDNARDDGSIFPVLFGGDDTITGTDSADVLMGYGGNDNLRAGGGNDTIWADAGNDSIDGGANWDSVIYSGSLADYQIARSGNGYTVTDLKGNGGTDLLGNVEQLMFDDKTVVLNIMADNHGGSVYRMYQAAMDRTPDLPGLIFWISQMDAGVSLEVLANAFIASNEYQSLYGSGLGNRDVVGKYYEHILHRPAEPGGLDFWTGVLDKKAATAAQVLAAISDSPENVHGTAALVGQPLVYDSTVHIF
jgi:Ca2+-binding RTX toxin-like protein